MKFSNQQTEAAYRIAAAGLVEVQVGDRSETDPNGSMWQALVRCNRTNLMRANADDLTLFKAIKPGHDTLMWLVEDEPEHIIVHKSVDCDADGYRERIDGLTASFHEVTAFYTEDTDDEVDFEYASA